MIFETPGGDSVTRVRGRQGRVTTCQGHRLFQGRVGPARFERRPTIRKHQEIMVGRRGEAPLVPPYSFRRPNKAMALTTGRKPGTQTTEVRLSEKLDFRRFSRNGLTAWGF